MKIVGTITEYNPFHNGHLYHLEKIKKISKCDCLVVVMSTYFTMRGELSIHNPFEKTKYALNSADIVVALPSVLAVNSADLFALNAVKELQKLNVTELYIGSENDDASLYQLFETKFNENDKLIKEYLNNGLSYKEATNNIIDIPANDLLGYCYYKAIKKLKANIKIKTIKRLGDNHNDILPTNNKYTSSTAIRENKNLIEQYCPSFVSKDILDYELLFNYLKYNLINNIDFNDIKFISEGIENRIKKNILKAKNMEELINLSVTKRYTKSRIRRSIFYLLFNIKKDNYEDYNYTRILGFNEKGKQYLNIYKNSLNIITNNKEGIDKTLDIELKIAKILDLIYDTNIIKQELKGPIIKSD